MDRLPAPVVLPLRTLRLAGRHWATLFLWFSVGSLLHLLLLEVAIRVGAASAVAGLAVVSAGMLVLLTTTVVMLHQVRPAHSREPLSDVVARALIPFVVFYGAWGLFRDEIFQYVLTGGAGLVLRMTLAAGLSAALASWTLSVFVERQHRRTGHRLLGVVAAFFEAGWIFFAFYSVTDIVRRAGDWLTTRVVWAEAGDLIMKVATLLDALLAPFPLPSLAIVGEWLAGLVPDIKDGLALPLLWLMITAVVYGQGVGPAAAPAGTGGDGRRRPASAPARLAVAVFASDARDKYQPLVRGFRLVRRTDLLLFLMFCACYAGLELGRGRVWMAVTALIGPHEFNPFWVIVDGPLSFTLDMVHETLRICLLAAALDLVTRRWRERNPVAAAATPAR